MTENEALEYIKNMAFMCGEYEKCQYGHQCTTKCLKATEIAIQALEEIQQYRAIGTVEEFKALKEKNTPKELEFMHNRSDTVSVWKCHCGNVFLTKHKEGILDGTDVNYCCKCGQKIDWSD